MNPRRFIPWAAFLALLLVCSLPLFLARHVPLVDYPTHLARMHILHEYPADRYLQQTYDVSLAPRPNLAMDLVVIVLSTMVPVETASRIFVFLSMALTLSGVAILNRVAHREWSPISILLGAVLLYNWVFAYGFMNFLFGLGMMLWAIAVWLVMVGRPVWARIMVGILLGSILFLCHIVPFVLFSVALGGIGLHRAIYQRQLDFRRLAWEAVVAATVCGLPAVIFLSFSPASGDLADGFLAAPWTLKLVALLRTPLSTNLHGDAAVGFGILVLGVIALWRGKITLAPPLRLVLAFVGIAFVFAPVSSRLGFYLNERICLAFLLLFVAALRIGISGHWARNAVIGLLATSIGVRSLVTAADWRKCDELLNRVRVAFAKLEGPAILYVAEMPRARNPGSLMDRLDTRYQFFRPPVQHIGAYAALNKGIFVPMVYAHPQLQPIRISERFMEAGKIQDFNPIQLQTEDALIKQIHDLQSKALRPLEPVERVYLYVHRGLRSPEATLVAEDPEFVIYRLR
jgi:hypothetical protein